MSSSSTLTAAQADKLAHGSAADKMYLRQWLLNHLGNEPSWVHGPGGIAGWLDNAATSVGSGVSSTVNAVGAAAGATADVGKLFGNLGFWKGIGLVLAGVLILLVVGVQLVKG